MTGLDGEAVVITGAGQGIGAACARAAAAAGAFVVVNDRNADAAHNVVASIRLAGGTAVAHPGDIGQVDQAEGLIDACSREFGFISGLVNNAALLRPAPLVTATVDDLRVMLEANVIGAFNCARAAVGPMLSRGSGSIVNVTSGAQSGQAGLGGYGATKGAVASFTYAWAAELADTGIRVNAVSPIAATAMSDQTAALREVRLGTSGRVNLPLAEANTAVVLYLLSRLAKGVTAQVIRLDGQKLSLLTHPAVRLPVLERDVWTPDGIAEAFDQTLRTRQLPAGLAYYEVAQVTGKPP